LTLLKGGLNLCGPNSLVIHFAKNWPVEFAQFAMDLADNGAGKFHQWQVKPDESLFSEAPKTISPVDFVLLAGMRYSESYYIKFLRV
jgi:hypothetical protein